MRFPEVAAALRRVALRPAWPVAAVALALRTGLVLHAWATNGLLRRPQLDAAYYLQWAWEIGQGDLAGMRDGGLVTGEPWFLNPLYAYLLAPVARLSAEPQFAVAVLQAALGAATAGLAAGAAARWFGRLGGWTAGLLVAFAGPLAQMDAHIAVTELAAFLTAGACYACAPAAAGDRRAAHGPVAAALWLGIGALARPITPLALPFFAWRFARESSRRLRTALVVVGVFAACALPSLLRNWAASGEPTVYTAAGGVNAHLGNNELARATRSMVSAHLRFNPMEMHEDARRWVQPILGRRPTRGEVSSYFWGETVDEFVRRPGPSLRHYLDKARWFFGPTEVPSSASYALDRRLSPGLALAFVPAWLLAALSFAGLWACRRRADVLLGPGSIVLAHWAILTLVFPLSHYRAPAIPAMAILASGAAVAIAGAVRERRLVAASGVVGIAAGLAVAGSIPPGPDPLWMRDESMLSMDAVARDDLEAAERHALDALEAYRRQWGRDSGLAWEQIGDVRERARRWDAALEAYDRSLELSPDEPFVRLHRSHVHEMRGDYRAAERDAREVVEDYPFLAVGHARLGAVLSYDPARMDEARAHLRHAMDGGYLPDPAALRRAGVE